MKLAIQNCENSLEDSSKKDYFKGSTEYPKMRLKCVWVGLAFFAVICGVEGIKCWVCRSDSDPRCGNPFDNATIPIFDCDTVSQEEFPGIKATMCRKISQKESGNWQYIRSCAFPGEVTGNENPCTTSTGANNVFMETCTCNNKDGCNSATSVKFSQLAVFLSALLLFKLKFLHVV